MLPWIFAKIAQVTNFRVIFNDTIIQCECLLGALKGNSVPIIVTLLCHTSVLLGSVLLLFKIDRDLTLPGILEGTRGHIMLNIWIEKLKTQTAACFIYFSL